MDREKVISALHCRAQDLMIDRPACDQCGYQIQMVNRMGCDFRRLCKDAIELLKEQESVIESLKSDLHETLEVVSGRLNVVRCKDCKHEIYCRRQGKRDGNWFCAGGERK